MSKVLYGYAKKDVVKYRWRSESGACDKCQEMNGTTYESSDEIPDKPHPNCKCWIEEIEREVGDFEYGASEETSLIKDPIQRRREEYKKRERRRLELAKLMGDVTSLEEEIDAYINEADKQQKELEKIENSMPNDTPQEVKQKVKNLKSKTQIEKNNGHEMKNEVIILKADIQKNDYSKFLENSVENLKNKVKEKIKDINDLKEEAIKKFVDSKIEKLTKNKAKVYGYIHSTLFDMPNAYNLFKIGVNDKNYNEEFVRKNGKLYKSIDDLDNAKLEKDIRNRISQESDMKDCKVLVLNSDSSVSNAIQESNAFSRFIEENKDRLKPNTKIEYDKIEFKNDDSDLYSTLHGAEIKNISVDKEGNLNMRVEDFYNFNKGRLSGKGRAGEKLQDDGVLEPFYVITVVKIPKEKWQKKIK